MCIYIVKSTVVRNSTAIYHLLHYNMLAIDSRAPFNTQPTMPHTVAGEVYFELLWGQLNLFLARRKTNRCSCGNTKEQMMQVTLLTHEKRDTTSALDWIDGLRKTFIVRRLSPFWKGLAVGAVREIINVTNFSIRASIWVMQLEEQNNQVPSGLLQINFWSFWDGLAF